MSATAGAPVDYAQAARRHLRDGEALYRADRHANAGQLFGFAAECGLKAMLVACKVAVGADGCLPPAHPAQSKGKHPLREHVPVLLDRITQHGQLIPDGVAATRYLATMPRLVDFKDWSIDHRYWREGALPLDSVAGWCLAAGEVGAMLDAAEQDGVLP